MSGFDIEKLQQLRDNLEETLSEVPILKKAKLITSVPIVYLLLAAIIITLCIIYVCSGMRAITMVVATVE